MRLTSLVLCCLFSMTVSAASSFLPNASIVSIKGLAFINKEQVEEGAEVAKGMEIKIPKKGDYVIIKFQNGHKLALVSATARVEELTEKSSVINILKGESFASVVTLSQNEQFVLKNKYATYSAQPSHFGLFLLARKKKAHLQVHDGLVTVKHKSLSVDVQSNEELWVARNTKKLEAQKIITKVSNEMLLEMDKSN